MKPLGGFSFKRIFQAITSVHERLPWRQILPPTFAAEAELEAERLEPAEEAEGVCCFNPLPGVVPESLEFQP